MELRIHENIKRLRKEHSMTQEQLAEALGVTVGAVYKWENGLSTPEIRLLVELADFFGVSVDYLLGYTVLESGADAVVERIRSLTMDRKLTEAVREAEKALQKFPNDFKVVYHSAQAYLLRVTQDSAAANRTIELLERLCLLFDQNPYEGVTLKSIQETIAVCYIGLKQYDKTIEQLKKLNMDGSQDEMIGLILAQFCNKPEEALPYLSAGFHNAFPLRSVIGFAQAYTQLGRYDDAFGILQWAINALQGLRYDSSNSPLKKVESVFYALLADASVRRKENGAAYTYLKKARDLALEFDAAPDYRISVGLKFYHGDESEIALDDMGDTAILAIEEILERNACDELKKIWEEIKDEEI